MKILILGCSHSLGAWKKIKSYNNHIDINYSWVAYLAREYREYNFINFSHPAGGIFNYIITLSKLKENGFLDKIDKVIIQYTSEFRLTFYHVDKFSFDKNLNIPAYNDNYPYNMEEHTNYQNYKLYNFSNFKKTENSKFKYDSFQLQDAESICKKILETDDEKIKNKLKVLYEDNFYLDFVHKNLLYILEKILLNNKDVYSFNWFDGENSIYNCLNNISDNLYDRISARVDNYHLDMYGNKLVYELLKDEIEQFIKK